MDSTSIAFRLEFRLTMKQIIILSLLIFASIAESTIAQISPEARAIIDRFNEVTGGSSTKSSIQNVIYTGHWSMAEREIKGPAKIIIEDGSLFVMILEIPEVGVIRNCYVDGQGWVENPMSGVQKLNGTEFENMGKSAILFPENNIDTYYKKASLQETSSPDTLRVYLEDEKGYSETWDLDSQTGFLNSVQTVIDAGVRGSFKTALDLFDYQMKDGILFPHRLEWNTPAYQVSIIIDEVLLNTTIDKDNYQYPATLAEQPNQ